MSLEGKVALVTGAGRGIGRAVAERLGRDGAAVVVNYNGSEEQAREVVAGVEKAGGRAAAVRADVSKVAEVVRLFDATLERYGRLDVLVNNAGVILYKMLVDTTEEEFDRLMAINVRGRSLPANRRRGGWRTAAGSSTCRPRPRP
jgi:3-oxoacyl-[acyl-carrier protein] reductase